MNSKIRKLKGSNMDIDFSIPAWGDSKCPWNIEDSTDEHKCAVKNTSICQYFCGVQYLDSVMCSYPYRNTSILSTDEIDRDLGE